MARLEDKQKPGLPRPPAPPRRSANPWKFSQTARKPEAFPADRGPDLLEGLVVDVPAAEDAQPAYEAPAAEHQAPPQSVGKRSGFGLIPLVVLGMAVLIVLRVLMEARDTDDWIGIIGPLLVLAFIAHGWWKARQRRKESKRLRAD